MRTVAISILAAAMLNSPASAQISGGGSPSSLPAGSSLGRQLGQINDGIGDGRRHAQLSRDEAKALRREEAMIRTLEERYARDGLSDSEKAELRTRLEVLRNEVNMKRAGRTE
ncbi:hypothetical protein D1610_04935 [Sphingomonas gilva]|uniref:Uncharacterized protein n=1 Tax=Sphingomonas gilva TaxID=2305907 RepID=A0A396RN27_9SPHN|nr:hypothetical protein [Sphingomonas gilva]RHW17867.1 hypothetical protein D1610_04935 [Sphingomonas gilva]